MACCDSWGRKETDRTERLISDLSDGCNITGSYVILLFTALDLASVTSHIHNWVVFLLWLHLFIPSGVIYPLISSRRSPTDLVHISHLKDMRYHVF